MDHIIAIILTITATNYCVAQYETCNQGISIGPGESKLILSPNYPFKYNAGSSCRYTLSAPVGYEVQLSCLHCLELSFFGQCGTERMLVTSDNDPTLAGANTKCGIGFFTQRSLFTDMVFSYISKSTFIGGLFSCAATAVLQSDCDCGWNKNVSL